MKRWVWIACMYTLYTPRCFAISQVEANIKQSSGLMRALTRPNGHAGVNTLEATLHCNAKGVAVSGYHIYTCSTNSISVENFILSQYTYFKCATEEHSWSNLACWYVHMGQFLQDGKNVCFMSFFLKSRKPVWPNQVILMTSVYLRWLNMTSGCL